jgi:hypothetical protein
LNYRPHSNLKVGFTSNVREWSWQRIMVSRELMERETGAGQLRLRVYRC